MKRFAAVVALSSCAPPLPADTPDQALERYAELAKQEEPAFAGFSAEHGHELYLRKRVLPVVGAINCASCHLADPRQEIIAHKSNVLCSTIKDAKQRKIPPLAPSANRKRLTNFEHVEEYLQPNCEMAIGRDAPHRRRATSSLADIVEVI